MGAVPARDVVLIVNPSAGGGRGARALPAVLERLTELGVTTTAQSTRDLNHARELAAESAGAGRVDGDARRRRAGRLRRGRPA